MAFGLGGLSDSIGASKELRFSRPESMMAFERGMR